MAHATRPTVPMNLESDLGKSQVVIDYIGDDGTVRSIQAGRDIFSSYSGMEGARIELRPYVVVENEVFDDPENPGQSFRLKTTAAFSLERIVNIIVDDEPEYGKVVPVSRWVRNGQGELLRFSQE